MVRKTNRAMRPRRVRKPRFLKVSRSVGISSMQHSRKLKETKCCKMRVIFQLCDLALSKVKLQNLLSNGKIEYIL